MTIRERLKSGYFFTLQGQWLQCANRNIANMRASLVHARDYGLPAAEIKEAEESIIRYELAPAYEYAEDETTPSEAWFKEAIGRM